ncbi:MAG: flagellar assembly protein T N-terminal domain-containing protein, partial [Ectothiorhodospira sp.]
MRVLILLVLWCLPALVAGQALTAQGMAPLEGRPLEQARRDAIEDALWHASAQLGVTIHSRSVTNEGGLATDETTLETGAEISRYDLVDEWEEDGFYRVQIRVDEARALCGERIRIAAVQFPLVRPDHQRADGLHGLERGVPDALLHRLSLIERVEPYTARHRFWFEPEVRGLPRPRAPEVRRRVREIAQETGADYLLAGAIVDVSYEEAGRWPWNDHHRRQAEVEVYLFKGETGELVLHRRASRPVQGEVLFPSRVVFDSHRFRDSDYGQGFDWVLNQLARHISTHLSCLAGADR